MWRLFGVDSFDLVWVLWFYFVFRFYFVFGFFIRIIFRLYIFGRWFLVCFLGFIVFSSVV